MNYKDDFLASRGLSRRAIETSASREHDDKPQKETETKKKKKEEERKKRKCKRSYKLNIRRAAGQINAGTSHQITTASFSLLKLSISTQGGITQPFLHALQRNFFLLNLQPLKVTND